MIRFKDGHPSAVWYSQHEYGAAYTYATVPKIGVRPISFSARGSHANYATAGKHDLHSSSCVPFLLPPLPPLLTNPPSRR